MLRNFRFAVEGELAGMAHPGDGSRLQDSLIELKAHGIHAVVSLDEWGLDPAVLKRENVAHLHLPIEDFTPPTLQQCHQFVHFVRDQIQRGHAVAAHCHAGIGRTGTMLAIYLVAQGRAPAAAIAEVRRVSTSSIETTAQERIIHAYAQQLNASQSAAEPNA